MNQRSVTIGNVLIRCRKEEKEVLVKEKSHVSIIKSWNFSFITLTKHTQKNFSGAQYK